MRFRLILSSLLFVAVSCSGGEKPAPDNQSKPLAAPSAVTIERVGRTDNVKVSWKDNSEGETSFSIMLRDAENLSQTDEIAKVDADVTEYTITSGLVYKKNYYIGVRANGAEESLNSKIEYSLYYMEDLSKIPVPVINESSLIVTSASICLKYHFNNPAGVKKTAWGLCWSTEPNPTIHDFYAHGPVIADEKEDIFQVISNAALEYGKTYYIRAYVSTTAGTYYSDETISTKLQEEPQAITLEWNEMQGTGLPSDIQLYSTTSTLNGRVFNAWYAIADIPAGNIEFRMGVPTKAATLENQYTNDNCILTNAGYFYNGQHTGISVIKGSAKGNVSPVRGTLSPTTDPEYNSMYSVTRGAFGVDKDQNPKACWVGTENGTIHYYDYPMTSVKGRDKYGDPTATYPTTEADWVPEYCLNAGPLLVKDGKIAFDYTKMPEGSNYYYSNYEIIPDDIFDSSVSPDRTAVGYTSTGKIILFVCDGRIKASKGATILELAQIMKGLGCVGAVNFDGGGSTAMLVMGNRINSLECNMNGATENRAVVSTMGFYKK